MPRLIQRFIADPPKAMRLIWALVAVLCLWAFVLAASPRRCSGRVRLILKSIAFFVLQFVSMK